MWIQNILLLLIAASNKMHGVEAINCTSCIAGQFFDACAGDCSPCRPGHYCDGACASPQPCGTGKYSAGYGATSSACETCPAGFFSNIEGSNNCTGCPAGHQCLDRAATPSICPRGTYSLPYSTACTPCPSGSYNTAAGSSSCIVCAAGYACPSPNADPIQCPIGSYSADEATICSPCPAGYSCPSTAAGSNLLCPDGSYSLDNWAYCVVCPAGRACSDTSSLPLECAAGTYSLGGETICRECPVGKYQPSPGAGSCAVCPAGYSCLDKTAEPVECDPGTFSLEAADTCSACSFGEYTAAAAGVCLACPAGYSCAVDSTPVLCGVGFRSALGEGACTPCDNGQYSKSDHTACLACEAGFECSNPTSGPQPCARGYYSLGGNVLSCTPCPAGSYCPNAVGPPLTCPSGTYSGVANASCANCPAGFQCTNPAAAPVVCPTGHYSLGGLSLCRECPAGSACSRKDVAPTVCTAPQYYSAAASATCSICEAGRHCEGGKTSLPCSVGLYAAEGQGVCQTCPAGSFCPTPSEIYNCPKASYSPGGSVNCTVCPAGYACPTKTGDPIPCAWGTYSLGRQSACTDCPPGSACPSTRTEYIVPCDLGFYPDNFRNSCIPCAPGKYCPNPITRAQIDCESGTYSPGGLSTCLTCPAGYSCDVYGASIVLCANGQYSVEGDSICHTCAAGYQCPSREVDTEIPCRAGTFSLGGQMTCTACPAGYACPSTATISDIQLCINGEFSTGSQTSCTLCPAGYSCPSTDSDALYPCSLGDFSAYGDYLCYPCWAGYYCPDPADTPIFCPAGFYSLGGWSACAACPAGFQCSNPAASPTICPGGTYSSGASTTCLPCAAGFMCPSGSTNPTPPGTECAIGGFCSTAGTYSSCLAGTYGIVAAGQSQEHACASCLPGYYCPTNGLTINTMVLCPPRAYCPAGSVSPTYCTQGTTSLLVGQSTSSVCQPCARSTYCPSSGSTPLTCTQGYYCPVGTHSPIACPAGTYGDSSGFFTVGQCNNCTVGHYCLAGSFSPTPCSAGRYMPFSGSSRSTCLPCEAGYACPSTGMSYMTTPCAPGYYCASGTISATQTPCPAGTYSDAIDLASALSCSQCPAGFTCGSGTTSNLIANCRAGRYCPVGTATGADIRCPAGTYSTAVDLTAVEDCTPCPAGSYCAGGSGSNAITGACRAGYYCPVGTRSATSNACPAGTYSAATNLYDASQCTACEPGYFCPVSSTSMSSCPAGKYSSVPKTASSDNSLLPSCLTCPAGSMCEEATVDPVSCGLGYYSPAGRSSCIDCPKGYYCANATTTEEELFSGNGNWDTSYRNAGMCFNGTLCDSKMMRPPDLTRDACPAGFYCPAGTTLARSCPGGTYNSQMGADALSDCLIAPAGFYTIENSTAVSGLCAPGHYCPAGSTSAYEAPCPSRFYRLEHGAGAQRECALCVAGGYCPLGSISPAICPRGFYCPTGVSSPEPCRPGTYGNTTGLRDSSECALCSPGMYCDGFGMTKPRGFCDPGYFCLFGANTSTPRYVYSDFGLPSADVCPQGHYCPLGTATPVPCPAGYYGPITSAASITDCLGCPPGYYCEGLGLDNVTGPCAAGYFCTGFAYRKTQNSTEPGYYSPERSENQLPCLPGTYNNLYRQENCISCPAGYYCNSSAMKTYVDNLCPAGSYCPEGSKDFQECPAGTYSGISGISKSSQCVDCPPGMYCESPGSKQPTGFCEAGYYCIRNSRYPSQQNETLTGGPCKVGHYCPRGTSYPVECPKGTFMASRRSVGNVTFGGRSFYCDLCPPGKACANAGSSSPTGNCLAGYFCNLGSYSTTPTCSDTFCADMYGRCPIGYYCPAQVQYPIACPNGTYTPTTGAMSCSQCPKGSYCLESIPVHKPCPLGYYCPAGTSLDWRPCPVGRYGATTSLFEEDGCLPCPEGMFCAATGLSQPSGNCSAGYYCPLSSFNSVGQTVYSLSHLCPAGSYCPRGSGRPLSCPKGTFNPVPGVMSALDCVSCLGGQYCLTANLTSPSGDCDEGFYCKSGSDTPRPLEAYSDIVTGRAAGGGVCAKGTYCPTGSTLSLGCTAGTYNDLHGQGNCVECPAGYFCEANTTDFIGFDCPSGHYCPNGTQFWEQFPCPAGTFNNKTNGRSAADCFPAPPGYYSQGSGNINPTGLCDVGYYCPHGSNSKTPYCETDYCSTGGGCYPGLQCPAGTGEPVPCSGGMYCADSSGLQTGLCLQGYYCVLGSHLEAPVDLRNSDNEIIGDICPQGRYCPAGSSTPIPCLAGTYSNSFGNTMESDCVACTPGYFCPGSGTITPTLCDDGSYCPIGSRTSHLLCDEGRYCPAGSSHQTECDPGTYQDEIAQIACKPCPPGSYCPRANVVPIDCPIGSYCVNNTRFMDEFLCPPGTFSNRTRLTDSNQCFLCSEGSYCETHGLSEPTGLCDAGYYCTPSSNTRNPTDGYGGDICPPGHYCPQGSSAPLPCPAGTNSTSTELGSAAECGACAKGFYCPNTGTVLATLPCPGGYFCPGGVDNPANDANLLCPKGTYCPQGTSFPVQCAAGFTQSVIGQDKCDTCPAGFYCLSGNLIPLPCPEGHYCLQGTAFAKEYPCPPGYYVNHTMSESLSDCKPCDPGKFCSVSGLAESEGPCNYGYFCGSASAFSSPFESGVYGIGLYIGETCVDLSGATLNDKCPPGHYCPTGSSSPVPCPAGTNSTAVGLGSDLECGDCTKGFYCPNTASVNAELPCQAGYFCPGGVANPADRNDLICPTGSRCPVGSDFPIPCDAGSYQDERGNDTCKACPIGYFCEINSTHPILCPSGYYCPFASNNPREFPCPVGTYNPLSGLRISDGCLPCVEGSYCETPGLSQPTGLCAAGYYCGSGATTRAPIDMTGSDICTQGHYCPEGSVLPTPCPAGTNSTSLGLRSDNECGACTKGYFCPNVGTVRATLLCLGGYYCPGGIANPATNDSLLCPPGHQCPEGSNLPQFCKSGTYQVMAGQTYCNPCAAGFYCQSALSGAEDCPIGHYCPEGTTYSTEFPCPIGTYSAAMNLKNASSCTPCSPGAYCDTEGQTDITGFCDAGYFCGGGSSVANPFTQNGFLISYSGETCISTDLETTNNICPPGHYCPMASSAPIQCPPGTNTSSSGLQSIYDCQPCIKGYYCPLNGTVFSNRLCLAGYFCPGGVINPALNSSLLCPIGHYCPLGSDFPEPCPPGEFQDETGTSDCKQCPPGHYCDGGTVDPIECPEGHFCPQGTKYAIEFPCVGGTFAPSTGYSNCTICPEGNYCEQAGTDYIMCTLGDYCPSGTWIPQHCPNGTYGQIPGLSASSQCSSCPGGSFCRGGIISGVCSPGYFCRSGQSVPSPLYNLVGIFAPEDQLMFIETKDGAQCPPGHYCPKNSTVPLACLNNTVRLATHGKTPGDCGPCPGGYICYPGNPVPEPCAAGYYCPEGLSSIPCDLYLYNPLPAQSDPEACLPCPAGYYCDDTGLSGFSNLACPVAHYCTEGTSEPSPCPAGTYRDAVGGANITDCQVCPPGHFCPRKTSVYYPCPKGTYCPAGSANTTFCPPGYFCPPLTGIPHPCPENYYCPIGLGDKDPIPCFLGTFCPSGTDYPNMCPLGSRAVDESNFTLSLLSSIATACEFCPPGTYGDDPARLVCDTCLQGYVCLGNTTTSQPTSIPEHNGFMCPPGFYCPAGSFEATACPAGTFQPFSGQSNATSCALCDAGFYQNEPSSTACKRCSTSSTSEVGAEQCTCIGQNRAFQASDGWCICEPGYEFVDFNFEVSTDSDGSYDCQPVVYDRCVDNEVRTSSGGCDTKAGVCATRCGEIGGVYFDVTGECECNDVVLLDELCDETCRKESRTVTCLGSGLVAIADPTGLLDTVFINPDDFGALGSFSCAEAGSNIFYISATASNGFTGIFDSGAAFDDIPSRRLIERAMGGAYVPATPRLGRSLLDDIYTVSNNRVNRFLQTGNGSVGLISDPIVCINRMDSVIFDVTNEIYPKYVKNSLLNSNPLFDYGAFRDLAAHAASTTLTISKFAFSFVESGTYVFSLNNQVRNKILIVIVMPDHIVCPRYNASQFVEFTASNLIVLGIKSDDNIVLSPDWRLILGLLIGMFLVVLLLIAFLYAFRLRAWSTKSAQNPKYRSKKEDNLKTSKGGFFKKNKVAVINDNQDPEKADLQKKFAEVKDLESAMQDYSDDFEDEEPELGKKIQKHHDEIDRHMHIQNDILNSLQETLVKEVEELKTLLTSTALELNSGTAGNKFKPVDAFMYRLRTELSNRELYERDVTTTEAKILQCMESLQKLLKNGAGEMSMNITDQVESSVIELDKHSTDAYHRSADSIQSYTLHSIISELNSIEEFVNDSMLPRVNEEKVRREKAESFFEQALKTSNFDLSQQILDGINRCMNAESRSDSTTLDILTAFTSFADRTPRLIEVLLSTEKGLSSNLLDIVGAGNNVAVLHEKEESREVFEIYLQQLSEALELLLSKIDPTLNVMRTCRNRSVGARTDLIEILEHFRPTFAMNTEDIMPLIQQMRTDKELIKSPAQTTKKSLSVDITSQKDNEMEDMLMTPRIFRVNSVNMIERSMSLSADQKHDLINRFANDVEIMENIVDIEKQRQQDAYKMAMEVQSISFENDGRNAGSPHESSDVIARRHAQEKEELERRLEAERLAALSKLERKSSMEISGDVFMPKEKMLGSLIETSYVVKLKQLAFSRKVEYASLSCDFLKEKLSIRLEMANKEKETPDTTRRELISKEHGVLSNCEHLQKQLLDAAETRMIAEREAILQNRSDKKSIWLMDSTSTNAVDVEIELQLLKNEVAAEFDRLHNMARMYGDKRRDANAVKAQLSMKITDSLSSDIKTVTASSKMAADLSADLTSKGIELDSLAVESEVAGFMQELNSLSTEIESMIMYAFHYSPSESHDKEISVLVETMIACYDYDFNLHCRSERVMSFCDRIVQQCRALAECPSVDSFEAMISDIKSNTSIKYSGTMEKKADIYNITKQTEIERLTQSPYEFDMEAVMLIERYSGSKLRRRLSAESFFRSQLVNLMDALGDYQTQFIKAVLRQLGDDSAEDLSAYGLSTDLEASIVVMIDNQASRCEFSIIAAFSSILYEMGIGESHSVSVLNGMVPNVKFAETVLEKSLNSEMHHMRFSCSSGINVIRAKADISIFFYFKSEVKRMLALGRNHMDLMNMLSEVKSLVIKSHTVVEKLALQNRDQFENFLRSQNRDKKKFEREYEASASSSYIKFLKEVQTIHDRYEKGKEDILSSSDSKYILDRELFELGCKSSASVAKLHQMYRTALNDAFKSYSLSMETQAKVEDEMRGMLSTQNGLQLDFSVLSFSCFVMDKLDSLRSAQENRRQQSELIRKQHQRELDGLLGELDHKKAQSVEYLKNRLKLREKLRVKALMTDGVNKNEAVQKAATEYLIEEERGLRMIETRIEEEVRVTKVASNNDLDLTVQRMKKEAENALQSLQEGFEAYSARQKAALEKKLLKRRSKVAADIMKQDGLSEKDALKKAGEKLAVEDETQRVKLQSVMKCFESDIQIKIDEESEDCLRRLKRAQLLERDFFVDSLERKKLDQLAKLDSDLDIYIFGRIEELIKEDNLSAVEATRQATEEANNAIKSRRLAEIDSDHKLELREYDAHASEFLDEQCQQIEEDKARMHLMLQKGVEEHCNKEINSIRDSFANRKSVAINALRADGKSLEAAKAIVDGQFENEENEKIEKLMIILDRNKRKLTNCVNEIYDDILISMKTENEKSLRGLESSLQLKKKLMVESLRGRLMSRQKDREARLALAGLPKDDAARRARLEYGTYTDDEAALEARLDAEMKEALQVAKEAKGEAAKEFETFAVDILVQAEDKESIDKFKEMMGVSDAMLAGAEQSGNVSYVQVSTESVMSQLDSVISDLRKQCDKDIEKIKHKYSIMILNDSEILSKESAKKRSTRISELMKNGMNRDEAQRRAYDELHSEEEKALTNLRDKLEAEMDLAIMSLRRELEKKELKLVEDEFTKASIENNEASELNAEAKKLVDDLRRRYMKELAKARTELKSSQQNEIEQLMESLAIRRAKHETKLAGERVDAETRRKEFNRMALKEEEELSVLKRRHMEAERIQLLHLEEEYRQQLAAAEAVAKAREQSAAIAAMREAALSAERDAKARSESETARREVSRLRAIHTLEDRKLKEVAESKQMKGKEKLDDKLQRRRTKKEQELKKEQEQKLAILAAKQASEAAEAKAAKATRDIWMKKIMEVSEEADKLELTGLSKESHIFKIVLGERYVPKYQYDEFMKLVAGPRHSSETKELLQNHYNERISALKPVVAALLDEKNKARIDLLERLGERKADEAETMKALSELDAVYFAKQQQTEANAVLAIEKKHVEEQIELRQRQLGEISAAVNLYEHQDKKSAKALVQDVTSQIVNFRAKLALETLVREEKMNQERIKAEENLKKSHDAKLREMQEKMAKEEESVALGIERMKDDLFKKKDEEEKKQKELAQEVNKENKERIMSAFEKEHEAALKVLENQRQDKKNKLKNRLAARRSSAMAIGELVTDDVTEGGEDADGNASPRSGAPRRQTFNGNAVGGNRAEFLLQSVAKPVKTDGENVTKKQWTASDLSNPTVANSMRLIEEKLDRIDRVVTMLENNGGVSGRGSHMNFDNNGVFMDASEPLPGNELIVVPDESLSLQELSRLKFGRTVMLMFGLNNYEMKVANSLPPPHAGSGTNSNPFRYSYSHDHAARVIYIHINRISSSGDIGLIITHAASHIKVNPLDITNDASVEFIAEFYTNLRILNQDLYKRLSLASGSGIPVSDMTASLRPTSLPLSDRPIANTYDRGLPPSGTHGDTDKQDIEEQFTTPKKFRHNPHSRSQTELTLLNSLERAREHISLHRGSAGAGDQGYFTNQALQERIKAYTKRGSSQAVPTDFFNRYMNEGDNSAGAAEILDGSFPIGLQRYDNGMKTREDVARRGGHRRRHSLGAGSFDKDALSTLASGEASIDGDVVPDKADISLAPERTPSKVDLARADSFRNQHK